MSYFHGFTTRVRAMAGWLRTNPDPAEWIPLQTEACVMFASCWNISQLNPYGSLSPRFAAIPTFPLVRHRGLPCPDRGMRRRWRAGPQLGPRSRRGQRPTAQRDGVWFGAARVAQSLAPRPATRTRGLLCDPLASREPRERSRTADVHRSVSRRPTRSHPVRICIDRRPHGLPGGR